MGERYEDNISEARLQSDNNMGSSNREDTFSGILSASSRGSGESVTKFPGHGRVYVSAQSGLSGPSGTGNNDGGGTKSVGSSGRKEGSGDKLEEKKKKENYIGPHFIVSSSPHIHTGESVGDIMKLVIYALLPVTLLSFYLFGLMAVRVVLISVVSAAVFEALCQWVMKRPVGLRDYSAILTGLLLALNLPPSSPWWMIVVGTFFAIVIGKQIYGGLGYNPFNPALVARVVLLISFPVQMTAGWVAPSAWGMEAVTTATPLGRMKDSLSTLGHIDIDITREMVVNLLVGNRAGCLGEVSVILLLTGGIFLIAKRVISWHTPVSFIGTVWILTGIFHLVDPTHYADPSFHIINGGLFIGAFFMATDYVTTPVTRKGMVVFGVGCGLCTVVIRLFGAYPEGVSFAILLMNAATPLIDRYTKPTVFGAIKEKIKP